MEVANILLLLRARAVVFSPPQETQQVVKRAARKCSVCGAAGHNVATCTAAPCNRCGRSGHIGRECPDNSKGKKAKKGKEGKKDQTNVEEATGLA